MNQREELADRLIRLSMLHRLLARRSIASEPLYPGQLPLLICVLKNNGCTQRELADRLGVSPSSVALSTKRLQKAGYLEKCANEDNLRCNHIYLTDAGREILARCHDRLNHFDAEMFAGFNDNELTSFRGYVERVISNLQPEDWNDYDFDVFLRAIRENQPDYEPPEGGNGSHHD